MSERLHKLLAQHGVGSRRQVEAWIREGRVLVNGRAAEVGHALQAGERVVVDGKDVTRLLAVDRKLQVVLYHKPAGEMLRSRAGDDRASAEMNLPALHAGRWVAVNALGFGEDGLLILASEGKFALAIARHNHEIPVEYRVRALRPSQDEAWPEMPTEVDVEGQTATFRAVEPAGTSGTNMWFKVTSDRTLPRGAIRALFDAAGLKISRTMLVKWGPIALPRDLPRGRSRALEGVDLDSLYALAGRDRSDTGLKPRPRPRPAPDRRRKKTTARRSGSR